MSKIIIGGHKVTAQADYSTTEQFTGQYWIDGKKIYRKVFQVTTPNTSNTFETVATFSGMETLIKAEGFIYIGYCLNWYITTTNYFMTETTVYGIKMMMGTNTGLKSKPACVIVYYTKTTD